MKKVILPFFILLVAIVSTYVVASTTLMNGPKKSSVADSILIQTHWKQTGGFERHTPDHLRLGCWSTALAQIMYYHRLKPYGHVIYTSRHGFKIDEQIDSSHIDLSKLAPGINILTNDATIEALARYNYYAALAVEKDFGTDSYMHKLAPSALFEKHYHVKVKRYISWKTILPYTSGKLKNIIRQEIGQKRPLFLHFANLKDFGHSVVVDGYKQSGKHFLVHLNQGQGGPQDGWYDFDKDLLKEADHQLRVVYTFKPIVM